METERILEENYIDDAMLDELLSAVEAAGLVEPPGYLEGEIKEALAAEGEKTPVAPEDLVLRPRGEAQPIQRPPRKGSLTFDLQILVGMAAAILFLALSTRWRTNTFEMPAPLQEAEMPACSEMTEETWADIPAEDSKAREARMQALLEEREREGIFARLDSTDYSVTKAIRGLTDGVFSGLRR